MPDQQAGCDCIQSSYPIGCPDERSSWLSWTTIRSALTGQVPYPCPPTSLPLSLRFSPRWLSRTSLQYPSLCLCGQPRTLGCAHHSSVNISQYTRGGWKACSLMRKDWMITPKSRWTHRLYGVNFTKEGPRWLLPNQEGTSTTAAAAVTYFTQCITSFIPRVLNHYVFNILTALFKTAIIHYQLISSHSFKSSSSYLTWKFSQFLPFMQNVCLCLLCFSFQ